MQFLANWLHVAGEDWHDRVAGWVAGTGCDAWVVQREVSDPVEYVQPVAARRVRGRSTRPGPQAWLDWFDAHKVEAVGFGLVTLRRVRPRRPGGPGGGAAPGARSRRSARRCRPGSTGRTGWPRTATACWTHRFARAPGLRLTQEADHDGDDWAVDRQVLALTDGLRWAEEVDPVALALVSGADGTVPLRDQLAVLAAAFDTPASRCSPRWPYRSWRTWSSAGFLIPPVTRYGDPVRAVVQTVEPGLGDGRRRGGRRDRGRSAGAGRGDPRRHRRRSPGRWPARCTSCASWTTTSRPRRRAAPLLVVSQFTLYADTRKGRRPSWSAAAPAEVAEPLVTRVRRRAARARRARWQTGRFRAHMLVESVNVGPRTVLLETSDRRAHARTAHDARVASRRPDRLLTGT